MKVIRADVVPCAPMIMPITLSTMSSSVRECAPWLRRMSMWVIKSVLEAACPSCSSESSLCRAILVMAFRILALDSMPLPNLVKGMFAGNERIASPRNWKSAARASTMAAASWLKTIEQMTPSVRRLASGRIYRVRKNEHTSTLVAYIFFRKRNCLQSLRPHTANLSCLQTPLKC